MVPCIGILVCSRESDRQFVTGSYIRAVSSLGAVPLLLPFAATLSEYSDILKICHGFLLPGGDDLSPLVLGETPLPGIGVTDPAFDRFQLEMANKILALRKPVLAICRGMQLLNAACGGTIWQDLSHCDFPVLLHRQTCADRSAPWHEIDVRPESLLHAAAGSRIAVNSFHHQALRQPGQNVAVTARAPDGIIEAIELCGHPFAVGVQWHPETMLSDSSAARSLFRHFFQAVCE